MNEGREKIQLKKKLGKKKRSRLGEKRK